MARTTQGSQNGPSANDTPSSPSKTRRKRPSVQAILWLALLTALVSLQFIFWATPRDMNMDGPLTSTRERAHVTRTETTTLTIPSSNISVSAASNVTAASANRTAYKFREQLVTSPTTVVTAYFQIDSKFPSENYDRWMNNMLSTQEAMVIFTSRDLISRMHTLRKHALDRTIVICMDLDSVPLATQYSSEFWQQQVQLNPESERHRGYQLFLIWLSKSWFVSEAINGNWFGSSIYMWSDIGCYRLRKYRNATILRHTELVPRHSILQMAHHTPNPPSDVLWNDKIRDRELFYHSGSQAIGYKDTWREFHSEFTKTLQDYTSHEKFVGEDQIIMQSTCIRNPNLCAYIPFDQVKDNHYFGLRYALHFGGNYTLWRPPGANVTSEYITT